MIVSKTKLDDSLKVLKKSFAELNAALEKAEQSLKALYLALEKLKAARASTKKVNEAN